MLTMPQRIDAFRRLREVLVSYLQNGEKTQMNLNSEEQILHNAINLSLQANKWFTRESVFIALQGIQKMLQSPSFDHWISKYEPPQHFQSQTVAVIMAGNIPLVGFHDFLSVVISGHSFLGKTSSEDAYLLPALADILIIIEPKLASKITFTQELLKSFDAVIATGSDNTARYFDFYFGKYPSIIRKNRNSIAVLTGLESDAELEALADDIFLFFGLGCRNVSKIFVPENFDFVRLLDHFAHYEEVKNHSKYFNNYEYSKAIYLINAVPHFDNGFLLVKASPDYASRVAVLHYETYSNIKQLEHRLMFEHDSIQCVVAKPGLIENSFDFGKAQFPAVDDYADGVDTLSFLLHLNK
ncbi:MAG: aldehyde dehydrogenase [Bacteroidales bacterium]|nr:aldehyde dehydrogenase [Bacteroidales bacterium]